MTDIIKEMIGFAKAYMSTEAIGLVLFCFCGVYIWYQHFRNKLLKEQIDIEQRRGQQFIETATKMKMEPPNDLKNAINELAPLTGSILLVDDEAMILELISEMLRHLLPNFHIETASNGEEALKKIDQHAPSLLITDIIMPYLGGFDLLKILSEKGINPPALVISGYYFDESFHERLSAKGFSYNGPILFLQKPLRIKELINSLKILYEGKEAKKF